MRDDDFDLDDEFPLGDGTGENNADVVCPYCSEEVTILVDPGSGTNQEYIEDCEVCCNPWQVSVTFVGGTPHVTLVPIEQ